MSQTLPERRTERTGDGWTPLADLEQVSARMQRVLEQTFGELLADPTAWTPPVDIEEQDDAYVIEAELPGVKREDANIELVGNELTITGEIKERERKGVLRRRTRRVGRFEYRVMLPDQVDSEQVEAKLDNGVLNVRVPKAQQAQRRKIEVKPS
jgi:HSP20 family protein